jgi:hypothetical protein
MDKKFDLKEIVLIGRTYDEYFHMFNLMDLDLNTVKILDAASGVSSFCAEANAKGYDVTASDRIYCFSPEEIRAKCASDLDTVMDKLPGVMDQYRWVYFEDAEALSRKRERAYRAFIEDYAVHRERYVDTAYPRSRFGDKQFTVSLASHFLFLYDEHLDYDFHRETVRELIRVTSREVRIFPLINLRYHRSIFVGRIAEELRQEGYRVQIRRVDYEFLKGGNEMMVIHI